MKKGVFITFEGPDGAGKTSIQLDVAEILFHEGYPMVLTREPGGIAIAEQIRRVILAPENTAMDPRTEALLYAAARRQHLIEKILPALENGETVLCDRFIDSSMAYQGYGRGLGIDEIYQINQFAIQDVMPSLSLFFMIKPEQGLARIQKNRKILDRLDMEKIEFHHKVYQGYQFVAEKFPERIKIIDASRSYQEVFEEVLNILREFLYNKSQEN